MSKKPKTARTASVQTGKPATAKVSLKLAPQQAPRKSTKPMPPRTAKGTVRENSKQAQLIEMLKRSNGVTIPQIMDVAGWQQHSVRGFLSGTIKKKLGLTVVSEKKASGERVYHIKAA